MPTDVSGVLALSGAVAWTLAYVLIIRRGFMDRALGLPIVAIAGNVAIETTYAWLLAAKAPRNYPLVYGIWLALDVVIVAQVFLYGPERWRNSIPSRWFAPVFLAAVATGVAVVLGIAAALDDRDGRWSAYASNLLMSALFLGMLRRYEGVGGQSLYIAWAKLGGTLAFTIMLAGWREGPPLVVMMGFGCLWLDVVYASRLRRRLMAMGLRPWQRV